jgi:hypothetical protein
MNSMKVSKRFVPYRFKTQKYELCKEINFDANVTDSEGENLEKDSEERFHQEMQKYLNQCIQYHQKILM